MKIIKYFIVGIFILSSFTTITIGKEESTKDLTYNIQFSSLTIKENQQYINIDIIGANTCLNNPGKPILPMYTKKLTFPFGTQIKNV